MRTVARAEGLDVQAAGVGALVTFGELFLRWNERINLGGRIGPTELVEQHFADAFAAARFVSPGQAVIDVGTGGGLPAIPMAIVGATSSYDLWEPTAKKVSFLRTAVRELGLEQRVRVHAGRVDRGTLAQLPRRYDWAISRATFAPADWVRLGRQLVEPAGKVIVFATDEPATGCPEPAESYRYRHNRRLLVFGSASTP